MTSEFFLKFDLHTDWHIGDGKNAGAYADALTLKDAKGLPYLPGKSVKGLLREAFTLASENNWLNPNTVELLFGCEGDSGIAQQGLIEVTSAELHPSEYAFITQHPQAKSKLYRTIASTSIDHTTGVAKDGSLRSTEVTVPMSLYSKVTFRDCSSTDAREAIEKLGALIGDVCTLIFGIGAKRHRGFGNVTVSLCSDSEVAA
jgi:CRISPR/Cas system CSM-associated protein Csm3 (group 7 of RAMP superfamily)